MPKITIITRGKTSVRREKLSGGKRKASKRSKK